MVQPLFFPHMTKYFQTPSVEKIILKLNVFIYIEFVLKDVEKESR